MRSRHNSPQSAVFPPGIKDVVEQRCFDDVVLPVVESRLEAQAFGHLIHADDVMEGISKLQSDEDPEFEGE